jgi:hypothetical protein
MDRMRASFLVLLFLSGCLNETVPPQEDQEVQAIVERIQGKPLPNYPFNPPPISNPTVDSNGVLHDASTNTYHPTMIARYALRRYGEWRADPTRSDSIEAALAQTQWLVDNLDCSTGHGTWRFDFPASFDTPPGWASGMTQAHGIVALLALAQFSPDPKRYVSAAMCATRAFGLDVDEGGVLTATREGSWYEEYATPSRSGVLNGHIFALGGLYYGCRVTGWEPWCTYFERGMAALKERLPKYDLGFTSNYSLVPGNFASPGYHDLHIDMLLWAYEVSQDPTFLEYADRFQDYVGGVFTGADPVLTDSLLWYRSKMVSEPLRLEFDANVTVTGLSVFFAEHIEPLPVHYAAIDELGTAGPWKTISVAAITAQHTTGAYRTTAAAYKLPAIDLRAIEIAFDAPIALREIDVYHGQFRALAERQSRLERMWKNSGW